MEFYTPKSLKSCSVNVLLLFAMTHVASAYTNVVWTGGSNNSWSSTGNWTGGVKAGSTTGTTSTDVALFQTNPSNNDPVIDVADLNIYGITFYSASVGSFTIGTTSGNSLLLSSGGLIQIYNNVASSQIINAPLIVANTAASTSGSYTIKSDSSSSSVTLTINGSITGSATSGTTTLTYSGTNTGLNTINGSISDGIGGGKLGLTVGNSTGGSTLVLTGSNSYSGSTIIQNSTLIVTNSYALGTSALTQIGASALQLSGNITLANSISLTGGGIASTGALISSSGSNTLTNFRFASGSGIRFGVNAGSTLVIANNITDNAQALRVLGGGTLELDGNNSAILGLILGSAGVGGVTLQVGNNLAAGAGAITFDSNATITSKDTSAYTLANGLTFNSTCTSATFGSSSTGNLTFTGASSLGSNLTLTIANAQTTMGGVISGGYTLTKSGTGTLILSASNTYTGATTITAGTLQSSKNDALAKSASVTVNNAGSALVINYGGTSDYTAAQAATLLGKTTFGATTTYFGFDTSNATSGTATYGNVLSQAAGLIKTGSGTLVLTQANTYTGATTVSAGELDVNANQALGSAAAGTAISAGAALKLNNINYSTAEALTINGTGSGSGALLNSGTSTYAGQITAATNSTINTGGGTLTLTGGLVKNGTVLTLTGGGTVNVNTIGISGASANSDLVVDNVIANLNTANSYNGPTYIRNGGVINANVVNALPVDNGRSAIIMDDSGTGLSNLTLGASQAIASLTGSASSTVNLGSNTLTVGAASGSATFGGAISGNGGSLVKDGQSTQVLSGASTYTGTTRVTAGTLTVNGSLASAGTVGNAATLNGSGTISGAVAASGTIAGTLVFGSSVTVQNNGSLIGAAHTIAGALTAESGATIAPGASAGDIGTLTVGSFSLQSGAYLALDINGTNAGTNADAIITTANNGLSLGGSLILTIGSDYIAGISDTLVLILNEGTGETSTYFSGLTITGNAGSTVYSGTEGTMVNINGQDFRLTYTAGTDSNDIELLAVPEPSTWAMLVGGIGLLAFGQRLRHRAVK